jgi:2-polyprenyl-6-methoxyphenol hydroxylase-like FAD-dependent oxidoreductase
MNERVRPQVCIVGAGPPGTLLGNLLTRAGIDSVVLERLERVEVAGRARAGLLEYRGSHLTPPGRSTADESCIDRGSIARARRSAVWTATGQPTPLGKKGG